MKALNTAKIAVLLFVIMLFSEFAAAPDALDDAAGTAGIDAALAYGDADLSDAVTTAGADAVPAFALSTTTDSIIISPAGAEAATDTLLFVSESGFEGVYFSGADGIAAYDSDSFALNGVDYTIERADSAYRISSTERGSLVIGTRASNTLILPDTGRNVKILVDSREIPRTLPAALVFNSPITASAVEAMAEAESSAAERGSVSGAAAEGAEVGCTDNDEDEEDDGIYVPSYVGVVNEAGDETITADYCARRGDVTRLYEAVCTADDTAAVRMVVCPEDKACRQGACIEPDAGIAGKYCLDSDIMTADTAESLTNTAATKGTTVGFYTATYAAGDSGREFGAWSDYCRDDKTLIEYYCSEESRQGLFREVICPEGCRDGVCSQPPYCMDSDGGSFENVKGSIKGVTASGEYISQDDTCSDRNTAHEYSCDSFNEIQGFKEENKACGDGKYCSEGKCITGEAPAAVCNQCDMLNDFNIRDGTACNADGTQAEWQLKRCPAGQYCNADNCVAEPKATMTDVTSAFNHRKKWALLLNETLSWIETARGVSPPPAVTSVSSRYTNLMEEIAGGLSSTQLLLVRRYAVPDIGGGIIDDGAFGGSMPRP